MLGQVFSKQRKLDMKERLAGPESRLHIKTLTYNRHGGILFDTKADFLRLILRLSRFILLR